MEQWGKPHVYYKTKAVLGFPGGDSLVFNFCRRKELFFDTGVRRISSQGAALALTTKTGEAIRVEMTGQWGPRADVRWSSSQGVALALAVTTAEAMRTATCQWGLCADVRWSTRQGALLVVAAKARDVMKLHDVLVDPSKEITQKKVQAMGVVMTGQSGPCEARLQMKTKRQAV